MVRIRSQKWPEHPMSPIIDHKCSALSQHCFKESAFKTRSILFDPLLRILGPTIHPTLFPPSFQTSILVTGLCSQHQGQRAHRKVWFSCPGFYRFPSPLTWLWCYPALWRTEVSRARKALLLRSRLSEPFTLWSKGQSCLLTARKNGDAWSLIFKENRANRGFSYKCTDNQLELWVHLPFGYYIENILN